MAKKVRRKITNTKCSSCKKIKPIVWWVLSADGWQKEEESRPECLDCATKWTAASVRTKRVLREARDRLKHRLTTEKRDALRSACMKSRKTLEKWERKLMLVEEED